MNLEHDPAALELFPDALIVVGADRVVRAGNALAARLVRRSIDELIGAPAASVVRLEEPSGADWWACSALPDADPALLPRIAEQALRLHRSSGPPVDVRVTGRRIPGPDGRTEALYVGLRRARRGDTAERRSSDLIATASHELRSPLTSVRGFTKTLLARWDRFDDATRRQMVATIDEDADRVTRLLAGLLDVSRIDAGRLPLRRQIVALDEVVEPLVRRFAADHPERSLTVDVPADLPDVVVDRDRIAQVLTNLLDNAVTHGAGAVHIAAEPAGDVVRCVVADEGDLPAAERERVFAKYYRVGDDRRAGLGLGLYISRGIVVAHGGRMWVDSAAGAGTRLRFTLPVAGATLSG